MAVFANGCLKKKRGILFCRYFMMPIEVFGQNTNWGAPDSEASKVGMKSSHALYVDAHVHPTIFLGIVLFARRSFADTLSEKHIGKESP